MGDCASASHVQEKFTSSLKSLQTLSQSELVGIQQETCILIQTLVDSAGQPLPAAVPWTRALCTCLSGALRVDREVKVQLPGAVESLITGYCSVLDGLLARNLDPKDGRTLLPGVFEVCGVQTADLKATNASFKFASQLLGVLATQNEGIDEATAFLQLIVSRLQVATADVEALLRPDAPVDHKLVRTRLVRFLLGHAQKGILVPFQGGQFLPREMLARFLGLLARLRGFIIAAFFAELPGLEELGRTVDATVAPIAARDGPWLVGFMRGILAGEGSRCGRDEHERLSLGRLLLVCDLVNKQRVAPEPETLGFLTTSLLPQALQLTEYSSSPSPPAQM
eukprot:TRINITY_DN4310_c0_g1_i1.p1 TRINITY_DN4310_c0_g1~~TRINITY_DN4310_c0_g1_i1.p1  ORF type:complete len:346 (+),score=39.22 TRINITY_DN4310_c0_g1_i1:25-1038(+)